MIGCFQLLFLHSSFRLLVSFSSISALIGNRGQANYVAANCFLDEFSKYARMRGFPAISINWGVLQDSGVVSRNRELIKLFEHEGIIGLSNQTALNCLDQAIRANLAQIGIFNINWERWGAANNNMAFSTRFRDIVNAFTDLSNSGINPNMSKWLETLKMMPLNEFFECIALATRQGLAKVLRLSPEKIGMDQKLDGLGFDSLILLELSMAIRDTFGIDISAAELFKQSTISSLTKEIVKRLVKNQSNIT